MDKRSGVQKCYYRRALMSQCWLLCPAPEEQRTIRSAEAERIRHRVVEANLTRVIGNEIHAHSFWFLVLQVYRGRQDLITKREHRDPCFQTTGASEQVSCHRFRRTDCDFVIAKEIADRVSF